jgi:hypothetical protein
VEVLDLGELGADVRALVIADPHQKQVVLAIPALDGLFGVEAHAQDRSHTDHARCEGETARQGAPPNARSSRTPTETADQVLEPPDDLGALLVQLPEHVLLGLIGWTPAEMVVDGARSDL